MIHTNAKSTNQEFLERRFEIGESSRNPFAHFLLDLRKGK
jgi:hypothetical protein